MGDLHVFFLLLPLLKWKYHTNSFEFWMYTHSASYVKKRIGKNVQHTITRQFKLASEPFSLTNNFTLNTVERRGTVSLFFFHGIYSVYHRFRQPNCNLVSKSNLLFYYKVFHRFRQAKFDKGGSILSSSQFLLQPKLSQKMKLAFGSGQKKLKIIGLLTTI